MGNGYEAGVIGTNECHKRAVFFLPSVAYSQQRQTLWIHFGIMASLTVLQLKVNLGVVAVQSTQHQTVPQLSGAKSLIRIQVL